MNESRSSIECHFRVIYLRRLPALEPEERSNSSVNWSWLRECSRAQLLWSKLTQNFHSESQIDFLCLHSIERSNRSTTRYVCGFGGEIACNVLARAWAICSKALEIAIMRSENNIIMLIWFITWTWFLTVCYTGSLTRYGVAHDRRCHCWSRFTHLRADFFPTEKVISRSHKSREWSRRAQKMREN